MTGDDTAARQIAELAESEERLTPRLIAEAGRPSTVKTRFIAEGQQLLRADNEITEAISDATAERVIAAIRAELRRADVMVLSDYMKGVFTDEVLATVIADARAAGVPVVADPKRHAFSAYSGVTVLKPNRAELEAAARLPCTTDAEIEICARKAMREAGVDTIMVSRSDQGMSLIRRDGAPLHLQARAQAVFDVSGAGDTVVAMTAVALAVGADLAVAAELANIAGGIVVGKAGTAVVSRDELATGLVTANASYSEAKVMSSDTAVATVERWRKQGHRVGFTNGSFDVLHPGHVSLLTGASAACDRLIVAIDGDQSVRRRKNAEPPILNASARAIVLASLSVVDMVVVFSEDTAIPLFELLKPDVLIQDGDDGVERAVHTDLAGSDSVRRRL